MYVNLEGQRNMLNTPGGEELIQKPYRDRGLHEKGIRNQCKDQVEMNQLGL
jgi:hypothetical protein